MEVEKIKITHKNCSKCKQYLSLDNFSKSKETSLGYRSACITCHKIQEENRRRLNGSKAINRRIINGVHYKKCKECKELLCVDKFYKIGTSWTPLCKVCHSAKGIQKTKEYKEDLLKNNPKLYNILIENRKLNCINGGLNAINKLNEFNSNKAKNYWEQVVLDDKKQCSKCEEIKTLSEFRPHCSSDILKKGYIAYTSHCNLCDAKRAAVYKNKKIETIEGKVSFLMNNINKRSKDKNYINEMSSEYLVELYNKQNKKCFYTGLEMTLGSYGVEHKKNKLVVSVDRKNSKIGYTKDNVVLCCWIINNMKQDLDIEDFKNFCKIINNY